MEENTPKAPLVGLLFFVLVALTLGAQDRYPPRVVDIFFGQGGASRAFLAFGVNELWAREGFPHLSRQWFPPEEKDGPPAISPGPGIPPREGKTRPPCAARGPRPPEGRV